MVKGLSSELKWRKKKWYNIVSPSIFGEKEIGQVPGTEPEKLIGKIVNINAFSVVNDPRKQSRKIKFKIVETKGSVAKTIIKEYGLDRNQIKRIGRKNGNRLDIIKQFTTLDNQKIKVQAVMFTRQRIQKQAQREMILKATSIMEEIIQKTNYDELIKSIIENQFQRSIRSKFRKEPLGNFEILKLRNLEN